MWSSRASYRPESGSVVNWAMSIVRHRAIHLVRRRPFGPGVDEGTAGLEGQPAGDDVQGEFDSRAETEQLARLLERLPDAQQQVIQLAFFNGLTHREIASRLALPPGTVKGRMRLGLRKLRAGLDEE
jgi:RNA polymerase sigma-70 factor, ECF subfamily